MIGFIGVEHAKNGFQKKRLCMARMGRHFVLSVINKSELKQGNIGGRHNGK